MSFNRDEFFGEYNSLISCVTDEFDGRFAALASPLLSQQETVSGLYQMVLVKRLAGFCCGVFRDKTIPIFCAFSPSLFSVRSRINFFLCDESPDRNQLGIHESSLRNGLGMP